MRQAPCIVAAVLTCACGVCLQGGAGEGFDVQKYGDGRVALIGEQQQQQQQQLQQQQQPMWWQQ
jgi:hypothetical protein